jgi:hypothetical protein
VDEKCRDGRVDTARERAKSALPTDPGPDARDLDLDDGGRRPERERVGSAVEEVLEDLGAVLGVDDLGVELDAVETALLVLEGGDRRRGRPGDDASS